MRVIAALVLGVTACAFEPGGDPGSAEPADVDAGSIAPPGADAAVDATEAPLVECKVDGADLGVAGLRVRVEDAQDLIIQFESWSRDPAHPDRIIGFTLSANAAGLSYIVRLGRRDSEVSGLIFQSPDDPGPGGPHAISRIEFCD